MPLRSHFSPLPESNIRPISALIRLKEPVLLFILRRIYLECMEHTCERVKQFDYDWLRLICYAEAISSFCHLTPCAMYKHILKQLCYLCFACSLCFDHFCLVGRVFEFHKAVGWRLAFLSHRVVLLCSTLFFRNKVQRAFYYMDFKKLTMECC